jgi:predicted O-methyltransferase YrrM
VEWEVPIVSSTLHRLGLRIPSVRRLAEYTGRLTGASRPVATAEEPGRDLQMLPGTPYSRYAAPLEYLPSRDFAPRWGASRPPIPQLERWFRAHAPAYHTLIDENRTSARALADIPIEFDPSNLPSPAWHGVPYAAFDSATLYTMVRKYRPRTYLEIGSGITTCFTHRAVVDANLDTRIVSIDPEPRASIDAICANVIRDGLETCDLAIFDDLVANDIVFFDGSHRSFMNSDVTVFFIDILPRLKPGVVVHIHDIMLPYDYPDSFKHWYWNEQYLLAVYLMGNAHRLIPLGPTAFICRDQEFAAKLAEPMLDLGPYNDSWRGGGAMWFTHAPT